MSKKILIVGANFKNKGAQSMLFITVDEIKKREKDCEIYFGSVDQFDRQYYAFNQLYYSRNAEIVAIKDRRYLKALLKCILKDSVKFLIGNHNNIWRFLEASKLAPHLDLMIDISGFKLGDRWNESSNQLYLNHIRFARKYNIPIYMMPQSFGPFCYPPELSYLREEIKDLLQYPKLIFAREKEGYDLLCNEFSLTNVCRSTDLVLQNTGINTANIYRKEIKLNIPSIDPKNAVGIVPNVHCFNYGDNDKNYKIYSLLISELLQQGKVIYILSHSGQDMDLCKSIAEMFSEKSHVHLLINDFTCLEYDELVKKFEFIICSRYHGIVHAYRNFVPCIILGWAVKYKELAECVCQSEYMFDVTNSNCKEEDIIKTVKKFMKNLPYERNIIEQRVKEIQTKNCFDYISELKG